MKRKALIKFAAILCIVVSVFVLSLNLILSMISPKMKLRRVKNLHGLRV